MFKGIPKALTVLSGTVLLLCAPVALKAQLIADPARKADISAMLERQKNLPAVRQDALFSVFSQPLTPDERQALEFLYAYMPLSDLADYNGQFYLDQVRAILKARAEMPWGKSIPEDVFLPFVLPLRVNNENLDAFRVVMYDELKKRVSGMSMYDAAREVNHWCHEKVTYRGTDERTSAPLATVKTSFGRCGEESTFTVTALRTVGIPARQVYTPRWAHSDDNHAWVEAWIDGKWYFLGACEPEAKLNMGWFAAPSQRAMLVHTRAYGRYFGKEPVIDSGERFSELNLIANYADSKTIFVKVLDPSGKPSGGARVEYQLYNYAEFYPIAKNITDENGISSLTTGFGDLLVWTTKDGLVSYSKITVESTDTLVLKLAPFNPVHATLELDLVPPVEKTPVTPEVSEAESALNARKLLHEDSIRTAYMHSFKDSAWAAGFAVQYGLDEAATEEIFRQAYGNWEEIKTFLESAFPLQRPWAIRLLRAVTQKDLRDTKSAILLDHLQNGFLYDKGLSEEDPEFYASYVLSGRISNEMMRPWRKFLQQSFDEAFAARSRNDISTLVNWIKDNIRTDETANLHSRSPLSPQGVYELKVCDRRSRDVFFVAVSRSLGIPARINPATYMPQYHDGNTWQNIAFEPVTENLNSKGTVRFVNGKEGTEPKYAVNFTIAKLNDGVFRSLDFEYGASVSDLDSVTVETGDYYLVTGNRLADGSVLASVSYFVVKPDETVCISVNMREQQTPQLPWGKVATGAFPVTDFGSRKTKPLEDFTKNAGSVIVWIDPDKEPSKHVMADIPAVRSILEKWGGGVLFLLNEKKLTPAFKPANFKGLPAQSTFAFDTGDNLLKQVEKLKSRSLGNNLPVIVIADKAGNLVYFSEGYKIGIGEQLAKEINRMR